jgi:hypothetical protein
MPAVNIPCWAAEFPISLKNLGQPLDSPAVAWYFSPNLIG